jgi:hypothetical protein
MSCSSLGMSMRRHQHFELNRARAKSANLPCSFALLPNKLVVLRFK